ncbi:hypothetical protein AVEN_204563-1 [Araneus ventricosus]|uniref:Uncharacterized protein n=1 Tax=Araneus ventricosus TaxID=182803 RepID=A0A4Y2SKA2_ARAVE|nr:hypothetical protein AVEN_204563-1 [Araneus ventricosus]
MAPRGYVISPNNFCFICGECTVESQQRNISDFVKKVYFAYFKLKLGDQDKQWAPHKKYQFRTHLRVWMVSGGILRMATHYRTGTNSSDFYVDDGPQPFSQSDLNDLVRDLGFSKDGAELLGSKPKK